MNVDTINKFMLSLFFIYLLLVSSNLNLLLGERLEYIKPDEVHIFNEGKIIKSGDHTLVKTLEEKGYQEFV